MKVTLTNLTAVRRGEYPEFEIRPETPFEEQILADLRYVQSVKMELCARWTIEGHGIRVAINPEGSKDE